MTSLGMQTEFVESATSNTQKGRVWGKPSVGSSEPSDKERASYY